MLSSGIPSEDELASNILLVECAQDPRNDPFVTSGASMQGRRGDLSRAPGANEGRFLHRGAENVQRTPTRTPSPENVWQPNRRYGESHVRDVFANANVMVSAYSAAAAGGEEPAPAQDAASKAAAPFQPCAATGASSSMAWAPGSLTAMNNPMMGYNLMIPPSASPAAGDDLAGCAAGTSGQEGPATSDSVAASSFSHVARHPSTSDGGKRTNKIRAKGAPQEGHSTGLAYPTADVSDMHGATSGQQSGCAGGGGSKERAGGKGGRRKGGGAGGGGGGEVPMAMSYPAGMTAHGKGGRVVDEHPRQAQAPANNNQGMAGRHNVDMGKAQQRDGSGGRPSSSPIIEQLKQRDRPVELSELLPHIGEIAQDQWGSRLIQQKLGTANAEEKQRAFDAIISKMPLLMVDVFGNYVIQKFFEFGDPHQRKILAEHLVGQVLQLSTQMYGCRVVQKAIESVQTEQQVFLVGELKGKVLECVEDQHGNHVIQKCIERLPTDKIHFIVDAFDGQVMRMAKHCYGCRVIQRLIEYCTAAQLSRLLDEVVSNVQDLGTDQYGNYVVQHVLEHSQRPGDRPHLLQIIAENILALSCHKYASNVVEKALHCGGVEEKTIIIGAIISDGPGQQPHLNAMMKDKFGNYIVQRALSLAQGPQREQLLRKLESQMTALKKSNTYGKHIIAAYNQAKGNQ